MSALLWIALAFVATAVFAFIVNVIAEDSLGDAWYQFRTSSFGLLVGMILGLLVGGTEILLSLVGSPDILVGLLGMLGLSGSIEISPAVFLVVFLAIALVARTRDRMGA